METKINTIEETKELFLQMLINKSDGKISKVSENSVVDAIAYGIAKICQKEMKDSALIESELFPEYAYDEFLDKVVERSGVVRRQSKQGSSVFVRIIAKPGTQYVAKDCLFSSSTGFLFKLEQDVVVDSTEVMYVELKSLDVGKETNVPAESITQINNPPVGHIACVNEIAATGGLDKESDADLLNRLLQNFNNFSLDTISKMKGIAMNYFPLILDIRKIAIIDGVPQFGIVTVNGTDLSSSDLLNLRSLVSRYVSLSDFQTTTLNSQPVINFVNLEPQYIDLDFRVDFGTTELVDFKRLVQLKVTKFLDYNEWKDKKKIEWENFYYIVRDISGVKSLPEQFFVPRVDIEFSQQNYPRLRGLIIRNLKGNVLFSASTKFNVYYPSQEANVYDEVNLNLI